MIVYGTLVKVLITLSVQAQFRQCDNTAIVTDYYPDLKEYGVVLENCSGSDIWMSVPENRLQIIKVPMK